MVSSDTHVLVEGEIDCTAMGTVDIRGMTYPVDTYKVIDSIENVPDIDRVLQADLPSLKLKADFDSMTKEEKDEALHVLHEVIRHIEKN